MPRVLIVDDELDILLAYEIILAAEGFEVATASDGRTALAMVSNFAPQVIVTDWMMPTLDGIELARLLQADPATRAIPVVLLTAAWERAQGAGGSFAAVLKKPVPLGELLATITRCVEG